MPIKNSWKNTRQLVEKSFNLMTVSGNSLTHQTASFFAEAKF